MMLAWVIYSLTLRELTTPVLHICLIRNLVKASSELAYYFSDTKMTRTLLLTKKRKNFIPQTS